MAPMEFLHIQPDGAVLLRLFVQPRASRNELAGLHDNALKLRLTTPPVEGRANKAVVAYLAKLLRLPKSSLEIRTGLQSRHKEILIRDCDPERIRSALAAADPSLAV
ncbi:MAG: DUF167 domain-containing protein [Desulfobulbaceae bacterium]